MTDAKDPHDSPAPSEPIEATIVDESAGPATTNRQTYNVVVDTVAGPNLRVKDNVFQAIAILVCTILGAVIGAFLVEERLPAALVGGFAGLIVGLFGSGLFLMIYRAVRHIRGRHD